MSTRTIAIWLVSSLAVVAMIAVLVLHYRRTHPGLPYHDSFAKHEANEWTPLGGSWSLNNGEMVNRSDEPGSKLISGSPLWADYQVDADLELRAHGGDVGIVMRVSNPETGINAYRGYYVGLRSDDSALVIGRADDNWLEGRPIPVNDGVKIGEWYHLKTVVVGCDIAAEATDLVSNRTTYAAFRDDAQECISKGMIGLRSTDTSGAWKNVQVQTASDLDLQTILQHVPLVGRAQYPIREDDNSRMRIKYFPNFPQFPDEVPIDAPTETDLPVVPIASLKTNRESLSPVRIVGVITFTDPAYLQDPTGGMMLQTSNPGSLNIGDEVEIVGRVVAHGFSLFFQADSLHPLRSRTSVSPISVTPTEAASGAHAGSLIEVTGVVDSRTRLKDGSVQLEMEDPAQRFAAALKGDLFSNATKDWTRGSTLRVRGICTMNPEASSARSFTILVASASDVSVISGPPWWSGWRLVRIVCLFLFAVAGALYLFFRFERAKQRAIMQEREHLAHEMHDTLAQSFAGVGYYLQSIRRSLRSFPQLPLDVMKDLDTACDMVTETHREASASIIALHPDTPGDGDLLTMLQRSTFSMLGGERIPITLRREGNPRSISPKVADALFHVAREAISNVLQHSQATSMTLSLSFRPKQVSLTVEDNGIGFRTGALNGGFGLQSMRRRCQAIGATLEVRSSQGAGCIVTIKASIRRQIFAARSRFRITQST